VTFDRLASLLWSERETLTLLVYRLGVQRLILESDSTRWLARSAEEIEDSLRALRTSEVIRAAEHEHVLDELRRPHRTTLAELAAVSPQPWPDLLAEHRVALSSLLGEAELAAVTNRRLLESVAGDGVDIAVDGHGGPNARQAAQSALERVRQNSLLAFLS
jgi:uncharacterized protein (UPF0147 family)